MARKPIQRELPPLTTLLPEFSGFPAKANHRQALTDALRALARSVAREQARPFYTHRELMAFFRVPASTVTKACAALSREGLLLCRRGSGTRTAGRRRHRTTVRGVVGLPLWIEGFAYFSDWRLFLVALEEELRRRDFAPQVVFFRGGEQTRPEMTARLAAQRFDHVLWFTPDPACLHILRALGEMGTAPVVVTPLPEAFPLCAYALTNTRALRQALTAWARAGLTRAVSVRGGPQGERDPLASLAAAAGLTWSASVPDPADVGGSFQALAADPAAGLILDDHYLAARLSGLHPEALLEVVRQRRVLVTRSVEIHRGDILPLRVDAALFDWARLARRIADDLAAGALPAPGTPARVEAAWHPRLLLPDIPSTRFAI